MPARTVVASRAPQGPNGHHALDTFVHALVFLIARRQMRDVWGPSVRLPPATGRNSRPEQSRSV
jgi:hypothetical protein